jgi:hypothetical protein
MALTYTAPTDDIILQEGVFAYNYTASGAIKAGQVVCIQDTMKVGVYTGGLGATGYKGVVGVAAYGAATGQPVAVYGPGNIVRCVTSGAVYYGDTLLLGSNAGHVIGTTTWSVSPGAGTVVGKALESKATASTIRVLLV